MIITNSLQRVTIKQNNNFSVSAEAEEWASRDIKTMGLRLILAEI